MARRIRWTEGDGIDERFAGQHTRPNRGQPIHDIGLIGQELRHVIADLRQEAAVALEGFASRSVDGHQTHRTIGGKHVGQAVVEQFTEQLVVCMGAVFAFCQACFQFCDTRLQLGDRCKRIWLHDPSPMNGSGNYSPPSGL